MKKYFIMADIHAFYDEMQKALTESGFDKNNKNHIFVSLGDLLDRGSKPLECLKFVNSLENKILIKGNHESLMQELLKYREPTMADIHNGTFKTVLDISHTNYYTIDVDKGWDKAEKHPEWIKYINSCVDYYETDNSIFVHGWIPVFEKRKISGTEYIYNPDWRDSTKEEFEGSRWLCGWSLWENGIREKEKTIYCGHWNCSEPNYLLHHEGKNDMDVFHPFEDTGIVCLDACTAYSNICNCYVLEEE